MKKLSYNAKMNLIIAAFLIGLACVPTVLVWLTGSFLVGIILMLLGLGGFIFYVVRANKHVPQAAEADDEVEYVRPAMMPDEELEKLALIEQVGTKREDDGTIILYWLVTFESNGVDIQNVYHTEWTDVRAAQLFHQRYPKGTYIEIRCSETNINEISLIGNSIEVINDGKFLIAQMRGSGKEYQEETRENLEDGYESSSDMESTPEEENPYRKESPKNRYRAFLGDEGDQYDEL